MLEIKTPIIIHKLLPLNRVFKCGGHHGPLHCYMAKLGHKLFNPIKEVIKSFKKKWHTTRNG